MSRAAVPRQRPPAGLCKPGRGLWVGVAKQVAEDGMVLDARDLRILREACTTADDLARLEEALAEATVMVQGSAGQVRAHPLFDEVRKTRALLAGLLARLDLTDPEAAASPGQGNPGNTAVHRKAAQVRWSGQIHGIGGA